MRGGHGQPVMRGGRGHPVMRGGHGQQILREDFIGEKGSLSKQKDHYKFDEHNT
jgi:hypothetical protein